MMMANIYNHLKCGIASPHGGTTRLEFRYCTPRLADALNSINDFNWAWFDTSGTRCDCASRTNGTMPYDTIGDAIFVVDMQRVQNDCYILWYDKTNDLVFCDLGGLEPQHILGCIDTSSNTVVLKNAQKIEDMKVRYAEKETHTLNGVFTELIYKIIDLEIDDSNTLDRGGSNPSIRRKWNPFRWFNSSQTNYSS